MIKVKNLSKIYKMGKIEISALKGVSIEIERGEFVAIMGHSGSGKSTLMNCIGCLNCLTEGKLWIDGTDTARMNKSELAYLRNKKIGFVFQSFNLLPRTNALMNVMLPLLYSDVPKNERREKTIAVLKAVGLGDRIDHHPNELSGGEQQRVAIARALVNHPSIILADEPTGNLDTQSGGEILTILQQLNKEGITIIIVTHQDDIAMYTQRIIGLKDGEVVRDEKIFQKEV